LCHAGVGVLESGNCQSQILLCDGTVQDSASGDNSNLMGKGLPTGNGEQLEEEQNRVAEEGAPAPTLWTELQQATAGERTPAVDLWAIMQERLDPSLKKPKGAAGVEVSSHHTAQGAAYYVLNNPEADTYLKVDAHDYFLWGLMDGEHSVRDLAVAYFSEFGAFPFERLVHLLAELNTHQLLTEKPVDGFQGLEERFAAHTLAYRLQRFSQKATQREFSLKNADGFFDSLYRRGGLLHLPPWQRV
jgi:hypothetical protein